MARRRKMVIEYAKSKQGSKAAKLTGDVGSEALAANFSRSAGASDNAVYRAAPPQKRSTINEYFRALV